MDECSYVTLTRRGIFGDDIKETHWVPFDEGFYIFNVYDFFNFKIERNCVTPATGGMCNLVVWNKLNMRLAYMETFNKIVVIPLPHLNLVNFVRGGA